MSVTIYHNPACSVSRNTLAMIRQSGEEPEIIEYLKTPPDRARLIELLRAMGIPVRALLRDTDARTRALACRVCGLLSDSEALGTLDSLAQADPCVMPKAAGRRRRHGRARLRCQLSAMGIRTSGWSLLPAS